MWSESESSIWILLSETHISFCWAGSLVIGIKGLMSASSSSSTSIVSRLMHEQRSNDAKNAETTLVPTQATRRSSLPVEEMEPFYGYSQGHSTKTFSWLFIHHRRVVSTLYTNFLVLILYTNFPVLTLYTNFCDKVIRDQTSDAQWFTIGKA